MLRKFFVLVAISFIVALAVSMTASYLIQTNETNKTTDASLYTLLEDVAVLIAENDEQIKNIRKELDENYLEKTRTFAEIIQLNPDILNDFDELCRIRDLMGVDELHVCDADGILRWGTVKDFYGYDFQDGDQTRPILAALDNPNFELAQDPQISGTGFYFQYISVSRYDEKGIVQIGMQPTRLEMALEKAAPENILNQIKIDKSMRILILSGDMILGDSQNKLVGTTWNSSIKDGSGNIKLDTDSHYVARNIGNYLVAAVITNKDMYSERNSMLVISVISNALILFLLVLIIGLWIVRGVIRPLGEVSEELKVIESGNLECRIEVRNTPEFEILSDGINMMVSNINKMLQESKDMSEALQSVLNTQIITEISQLLGEIHSEALENVKRASGASETSRDALNYANDGSEKMTEMVIAVKEINEASQDISKVMKTIDNIAFQTNILAINASVEAARASEHGKSFAVVAEEVRNLAGKSTASANQTEAIIDLSAQRVNAGVEIANITAGKITEIVGNIKKSASLMDDIVKSSKGQESAIGQLNTRVEDFRRSIETAIQSASHITDRK